MFGLAEGQLQGCQDLACLVLSISLPRAFCLGGERKKNEKRKEKRVDLRRPSSRSLGTLQQEEPLITTL